MNFKSLFIILLLLFHSAQIYAHGDGLFVPTLTIDEPTVGDELDFLLFSNKRLEDNGSKIHERSLGVELSKEIFPHFGLTLGSNYQRLRLEDKFNSGFDNIEIGAKYEFYCNECDNFIASLGLVAEIGKTGNKNVGAHSDTTVSPVLYFGKGLGNISDRFNFLQPVVITGLLSPTYCTNDSKIEDIELGLTFQYHLCNLNSDSKSGFINRIIPVVELPFNIGTSEVRKGKVTGTVNPGILFSGQYMQFGLEAAIPINRMSGRNVGALVQIHFFLDNIFRGC